MSRPRLVGLVLVASAALGPRVSYGRPATPAPPLPAPTGALIQVSTEPQLQVAFQNLRSNTTVVLAPGTYALIATLCINGTFANIAVRGATDNRDDVSDEQRSPPGCIGGQNGAVISGRALSAHPRPSGWSRLVS